MGTWLRDDEGQGLVGYALVISALSIATLVAMVLEDLAIKAGG